MVINNRENKDMVIKRLRFPVILWGSKYLTKKRAKKPIS